MTRRLLLVDDRSWQISTIEQEFQARGWEVTEAGSLVKGVEEIVAGRYTAAVFDRRMPRPVGPARAHLEQLGIPQAWIDALNDFNIGAVLGRLVSALDINLPYIYVTAHRRSSQERPADWPVDDAPMIDKMAIERSDVTLGQEVFRVLSQVISQIDE